MEGNRSTTIYYCGYNTLFLGYLSFRSTVFFRKSKEIRYLVDSCLSYSLAVQFDIRVPTHQLFISLSLTSTELFIKNFLF